jgi:hypothetical protein
VRRCAVAALVGACALVFVASASAAAPRYIRVSGPGLAKPVLLAGFKQNLRIMLGVDNGRELPASTVLRGRPRLEFTLFWAWKGPAPQSDRPPATPACLSAGAGQPCLQHDWFYPANHGRPAVTDFIYNGLPAVRLATPDLLTALRRARIPTTLR